MVSDAGGWGHPPHQFTWPAPKSSRSPCANHALGSRRPDADRRDLPAGRDDTVTRTTTGAGHSGRLCQLETRAFHPLQAKIAPTSSGKNSPAASTSYRRCSSDRETVPPSPLFTHRQSPVRAAAFLRQSFAYGEWRKVSPFVSNPFSAFERFRQNDVPLCVSCRYKGGKVC